MKPLLMASTVIAAGLSLQTASAASNPPARDFRAAANDASSPTPGGAVSQGPDCRLERLTLIWGPDRQPGAYECYGRARNP